MPDLARLKEVNTEILKGQLLHSWVEELVRDLETPLNMDTRVSALKFGAMLWRLYPAVLSNK